MGRRKGSLNKKSEEIQDEKNEVVMSDVATMEPIATEAVLDSVQTEVDLARAELERLKYQIEEKKKEFEFVPRRDISPEEKRISEKQVTMTNENKSANQLIEKQKAWDNQLVTGKFINRRAPGQPAKLTYLKYADDPVKWYTFQDGKSSQSDGLAPGL